MSKTPPWVPDVSWVDSIRAIALDTNAFGNKYLVLDKLRGLVDQVDKQDDLEVWLPETVVWEWAEHLHAKRKEAVEALKVLRSGGLTDLDELAAMTVDEMVTDLEEKLAAMGPSLKLLSVSDVAGAALRDQILKTGPANPKVADKVLVKTGAADSASLRAFIAASGDNPDVYVIVSNDGDYRTAFENWDIRSPQIVKSVNSLYPTLFKFRKTNVEIQERSIGFAKSLLGDLTVSNLKSELLANLYQDRGEVESEFVEIGEERLLVGIGSSEIARDEEVLIADLHFLCRATAAGIVQDEWGDLPIQVSRDVLGAHVRVPVTMTLRKGQLVDLAVDDNEGVVNLPAREEHLAAEDALEEVLDCLTVLPVLNEIIWWPDQGSMPADRQIELPGGEFSIAFSGNQYEDWTVEACFGDSTIAVSCSFLNDGFVDSEDGEIVPHHWGLSAFGHDAPDLGEHNPPWAINAMLVAMNAFDPVDAAVA